MIADAARRMDVPDPIKYMAKLLLRPDFRREQREIGRLRRMPARTRATTTLLGRPFELVDTSCFLEMREEIIEKEIYRFAAGTTSPRIIDCGANIGLSVYYFKQLYPDARILAFEPDPNIFPVLQSNCARQGFSDVDLVAKAVWNSNGTLGFSPEGRDASRLALGGDERDLIPIETCRLKDFLGEHVDFLKMDIEGAEIDVLWDCRDMLPHVERLFVEYHSLVHQPQRLNQLISVLDGAGYRLQIHHGCIARRPFIDRRDHLGMDLQLNVFAYRSQPC